MLEPWSVHSLSGSVPILIGPHAPSMPAPFLIAVHASQVPVHARSQQTPSTQMLLVHSWLDPHMAPSAFFARQSMPLQYAVEAHVASLMQGPVQAPPTHALGAQLVVVPGTQVPVPLQVEAVVKVMPSAAQLAARQTVTTLYFWQAP